MMGTDEVLYDEYRGIQGVSLGFLYHNVTFGPQSLCHAIITFYDHLTNISPKSV